jgi:hypothetical protein
MRLRQSIPAASIHWREEVFQRQPSQPSLAFECFSRLLTSSQASHSGAHKEDSKMKRQIAVVMFAAVFGFLTLSSHAMAQQKTAAACRDEWRANKAANQTNGVMEKAYVAQCRGGAAPAQTTAAPSALPAPAPTAVPPMGQKTAGACRDEWRANKAANQANGITEKAYVAQCRTGAAPAQTTAAPAPATAPAPAPAPTASAPPSRPLPSPAPAAGSATTPGNPVGANQFSTEAQAKFRCPTGTVVWVNLKSKVYHFSGTRFYGNTEHGAYMCESDTSAEGMRAAKNETHP